MGDKFDIRKYHDVVLKHGALPLNILEELVNQWITSESCPLKVDTTVKMVVVPLCWSTFCVFGIDVPILMA